MSSGDCGKGTYHNVFAGRRQRRIAGFPAASPTRFRACRRGRKPTDRSCPPPSDNSSPSSSFPCAAPAARAPSTAAGCATSATTAGAARGTPMKPVRRAECRPGEIIPNRLQQYSG